MADDSSGSGNGNGWPTWSVWVRKNIEECRSNIRDLYEIYHRMENTVLTNQKQMEIAIITVINETRQTFKTELSRLENSQMELKTKLATVTAIASIFGAGIGSILTLLIKYLIDHVMIGS